MGNKSQKTIALSGDDAQLQVQRCSDWKWIPPMSQKAFFRAYEIGGIVYDTSTRADATTKAEAAKTMLKLKDFPAQSAFKDRLPRHFQVL